MRRPIPRNGFTLVEVLVALVVGAMLVAILMDGAVTAKSRDADQRLKNEALLLAASHIDDLRNNIGEPQSDAGKKGELQWSLYEIEIARGPRGALVLVEAQMAAGTKDKPELVTLQKRYLKNLIQP